MRVADVLAGDGYYSELASYLVGPKGRVLLINNAAFDVFSDGDRQKRLDGGRLPNVEHQTVDLNAMHLPGGALDAVLLIKVYHDLYWVETDGKFKWPKIDTNAVLSQLAAALKPGGVLIVVDHSAKAGSGAADASALHRIDEAYAVHEPWLKTRFNDYGELLRDRLALGGFIRGSDYVQAIRRRRTLCVELRDAMADLDILVSASQQSEAPLITEVPKWGNLEKPSLTMPFNLTGYPAMSVCSGFGAGGLPVCMQLIAKPFAEATLFRAGHAYESAMEWRKKRPAMAVAAGG